MPSYRVLVQAFTAENIRREWTYMSGPLRSLTSKDYDATTGKLTDSLGGTPDNDGRPEGQVLYGPANEEGTRVRVLNHVQADPELVVEENFYGEPEVTCDLYCNTRTQGTTLFLEIGTSHGPFETSLNNSTWKAGQTAYYNLPAGKGTVYVRDAGDGTNRCTISKAYEITGGNTGGPSGELIDTFTDDSGVKHELYYQSTPQRTVTDFTTPITAPVEGITEAERGRAAGSIFRSKCEGTTQVQFKATLQDPYAEIVTTLDSVACGYPDYGVCTLVIDGVDVTTESALGKDATATIRISGAQGPVVYSLDGLQTSQGSSFFEGLTFGSFTATVQETRLGGCSATFNFTIGAVADMRYRVPFVAFDGTRYEHQIFIRGYQGEAEELVGSTANCSVISWDGQPTDRIHSNPIQASEAEIHILVQYDGQLADAYCPDERYGRAELWNLDTNQLEHIGWLTPDLYDADFTGGQSVTTLRVTDGLAGLKGLDFTSNTGAKLEGLYSDLAIVRHCLSLLDYSLPLVTSVSLWADGMAATREDDPLVQLYTYAQGYRDQGKDEPWDCLKVLGAVLGKYDAILRQEEGQWWLTRSIETSTSTILRRLYTADGGRMAGVEEEELLQVITPPGADLFWIYAQQRLQVQPAVASVKILAQPSDADPEGDDVAQPLNLLVDTDWPETAFNPATGSLVRWGGRAQVQRVAPAKKKDPASLLFLEGPYTEDISEYIESPAVHIGINSVVSLGYTASFVGEQVVPKGPDANTPADGFAATDYPPVRYAIAIDDKWLASLVDSVYSDTPFIFSQPLYLLDATTEYLKRLGVFGNSQVRVRFYQTKDVQLSAVKLVVGEAFAEDHTDIYRDKQRSVGRLTARDEDTTLYVSDTGRSILPRTALILSPTLGPLPTTTWFELGQIPVVDRELGDYLVRDRLRRQYGICQVLTGTLRGNLRVRHTLTDSMELVPRLYQQVGHVWNVGDVTHEVTLVEDLAGGVLVNPLPDYLWLLEDRTPALYEDSRYMLQEDAT